MAVATQEGEGRLDGTSRVANTASRSPVQNYNRKLAIGEFFPIPGISRFVLRSDAVPPGKWERQERPSRYALPSSFTI